MVLVTKPKRRNSLHHKKRTGTHHRHTHDYKRHYLPYLPLLAIVGIGLIANIVWGHSGSNVLGFATNMSASNLLQDTNLQRQRSHEAPLHINLRLMTAAQAKANDMAARDYWSHDTPEGRTPWQFITASGYTYAVAGENLAYGFMSSSSVLNGWMNSPEHRANILNTQFSDVGFGVANSSNFQNQGAETIVVAMYAQPTAIAVRAAMPVTQGSIGITSQTPATTVTTTAQRVARVQTLSGNTTWSLFATTTLGVAAMAWFVTRHVRAWKRVIVYSEEFIIHHRYLDLVIVSTVIFGYVLTRTAGFIR